MDYIERHLDGELSLEKLAQVAGFSKFHFHRIFYSQTGETLFGFIMRLRLEKGAGLLAGNSRITVTEAAMASGFANSSSFARSFKQHFGASPSQWRVNPDCRDNRNMGMTTRNSGQMDRNPEKSLQVSKVYIEYAGTTQIWRYVMAEQARTVEVKEVPGWTVAYVRYVGPYAGDGELFESLNSKLFKWAGARGLVRFPDSQHLIVYHDNPEITEEEKLRISVCLTVPADTQVDGEIGKMTLAPGKYAFARFQLGVADFSEAWTWVYATWLPDSGYVPDDGPCLELYHGTGPDEEGRFTVDICVPVKPL
jgi:AraC family transcriptional regulator